MPRGSKPRPGEAEPAPFHNVQNGPLHQGMVVQSLGAGGNCFDLAVWLQHAFVEAGVRAFVAGHDLETPEAHVASIARTGTWRSRTVEAAGRLHGKSTI